MSKLTKIDYESTKMAYDKGYDSGEQCENPYTMDTPNYDEFNKGAFMRSQDEPVMGSFDEFGDVI